MTDLRLAIVIAVVLLVPGLAQAEGGAPGANKAVPPAQADGSAPHRRHKAHTAKAAKTATPATPAAPVPYTTLSPEMVAALTPGAAAPGSQTPGVQAVPPPAPIALPSRAMTPDALPQPAETTTPPAPPRAATDEISLKCQTTTTQGKRVITTGTFYIDLFPSAVFPDAHADFKFIFVDPMHKSLIRDSICLDTLCPAEVTGTAYYLVNSVSKKGALRITLDRSRGAFYAEEVNNGGFMGNGRDHLGEQGNCVPQTLPSALF